MNFLKVKGSYYEMGVQQGEFFQQDIKTAFSRLIKSHTFSTIKPKFLPSFLFAKLLKMMVLKRWRRPIELLLPEYSQRIKGIADGANVNISDLYVIQSLEVMVDDVSYFVEPSYLYSSTNFVFPFGCSSVCVIQNIIKSPLTVIGKNFDYLSEFNNDHVVRISQPKNGFKSIEITYKQIAGSHDGMNEKGLVVLYNYGLSIEKPQTRIPITILVQQILERCSNVEEAVTFIKAFRYPNGAIITLVDSENNAVCVELTPEHIGVRKAKNGVLVATNFYLTDEVKKYDIPFNAKFKSKGIHKQLQGKRVHQSSESRYYRILNLIEQIPRVSPLDIENILKDHNNKHVGDDDTICRHGEILSTQVSMVFIPKQRKVKVCFGNPCKNKYVDFELD